MNAKARQYIAEVSRLCEEQGWTWRAKADGFLFFPPPDKVRPGKKFVYADGGNGDSHVLKISRDNFRSAGLKFPEFQQRPAHSNTPKESENSMSKHASSNGAAHDNALGRLLEKPDTLFVQIKAKINEAADCLADIDRLVSKIEADSASAQKIKEALKLALMSE